jgi:hypothetical protein
MYETYHFDDRFRVEEVKTCNSSNALQGTKGYDWDTASRITQATEDSPCVTLIGHGQWRDRCAEFLVG